MYKTQKQKASVVDQNKLSLRDTTLYLKQLIALNFRAFLTARHTPLLHHARGRSLRKPGLQISGSPLEVHWKIQECKSKVFFYQFSGVMYILLPKFKVALREFCLISSSDLPLGIMGRSLYMKCWKQSRSYVLAKRWVLSSYVVKA